MRHEIPPGALAPLRDRMTRVESTARAAEIAEAELGAYVQGLCLGLDLPFPPASLDPDTGIMEWPENPSEDRIGASDAVSAVSAAEPDSAMGLRGSETRSAARAADSPRPNVMPLGRV